MHKLSDLRFRWRLIFALLVVYIGGLSVLWVQNPGIARENGLMENFQAALLAGGTLISFGALLLPNHRHTRFVLMALMLMLLGCFLREVDLERLNLPAFLIVMGSGIGRNLLMGTAALAVLVTFVWNYRILKSVVIAFLRHEACIPFYLGLFFYLAGTLFDTGFFDITRESNYFLEEMCENIATYFLALGAIWTARVNLSNRDNPSRSLSDYP